MLLKPLCKNVILGKNFSSLKEYIHTKFYISNNTEGTTNFQRHNREE